MVDIMRRHDRGDRHAVVLERVGFADRRLTLLKGLPAKGGETLAANADVDFVFGTNPHSFSLGARVRDAHNFALYKEKERSWKLK